MTSEEVKINLDGELEYLKNSSELYSGPSESFYEDGNIQHTGQYEDGLMEGIWYYYYPSGKVYAKISYLMGIPHGLNETFHENGSLSLKGYSEKGNRVGVWTSYTSDGMVDNEEEYKDGERVN